MAMDNDAINGDPAAGSGHPGQRAGRVFEGVAGAPTKWVAALPVEGATQAPIIVMEQGGTRGFPVAATGNRQVEDA